MISESNTSLKIIDNWALKSNQNNELKKLAKVLRVFVKDSSKVPENRRILYCEKYLRRMGYSEDLYFFLILIFKRCARDCISRRKKTQLLDNASELFYNFGAKIVIKNCTFLIKYLNELPDEIQGKKNLITCYKTPEQFYSFKLILVQFLAEFLTSERFLSQVVSLKKEVLNEYLKNLILSTSNYLRRIYPVPTKKVSKSPTPGTQYWKLMSQQGFKILFSVITMSTPHLFIKSLRHIISHNCNSVGVQAMTVFNSKLKTCSNFFNQCSTEEIYSLVPPLLHIIEKIKTTNTQRNEELIIQTALHCMENLIKTLEENLMHSDKKKRRIPNLSHLVYEILKLISFKREHHIVKELAQIVLKFSESTYRNLYLRIFDGTSKYEEQIDLLITFYCLSREVVGSLTITVVASTRQFLTHAIKILKSIKNLNCENDKKILLLENVLDTLRIVLVYNKELIDSDKFEILCEPLVDQLENTLGGVEICQKRNNQLIIPMIVQLAVIANDVYSLKQLNSYILAKMKHSLLRVRMVSLHCLLEVVKKLGKRYVTLLPETIPVLEDLFFDESETVETACRRVVKKMENVLGEPIERYFKL